DFRRMSRLVAAALLGHRLPRPPPDRILLRRFCGGPPPSSSPKKIWASWIIVIPQKQGGCTILQWDHPPNDRAGVVVDAKHLLRDKVDTDRHVGFAIGKAEGTRSTKLDEAVDRGLTLSPGSQKAIADLGEQPQQVGTVQHTVAAHLRIRYP